MSEKELTGIAPVGDEPDPLAGSANAPHPEDPRKPKSPTDIKRPNWKFILKNTVREFINDGISDSAAGLTYYTVLSIFPGLIALVSILGLFGQSGDLLRNLIIDLQQRGAIPLDAMDEIMPAMDTLLETPAPGIGLILGIVVALWTASNYVRAFSRAMNRIYEVPEGRGVVKLYGSLYALTAIILVGLAVVLMLIALTGPLAESIGSALGVGELAVTVFSFIKWPILLLIVIVIVALLYWGTPNVRQPKFRWLSVGAVVAIIACAVASVLFGIYVANFGSYDRTYGTLAGVIIFLFWIYIMNTMLLFGGELDAELERGRELQGGIAAEEAIQLPMRGTKAARKKREKQRQAVAEARALRMSAGRSTQPGASIDGHDTAD